jgi:hypothetical protein
MGAQEKGVLLPNWSAVFLSSVGGWGVDVDCRLGLLAVVVCFCWLSGVGCRVLTADCLPCVDF